VQIILQDHTCDQRGLWKSSPDQSAEAIDLASEALDTGVVSDYLSESTFQYYKVTGASYPVIPCRGNSTGKWSGKQIAIETKKLISE